MRTYKEIAESLTANLASYDKAITESKEQLEKTADEMAFSLAFTDRTLNELREKLEKDLAGAPNSLTEATTDDVSVSEPPSRCTGLWCPSCEHAIMSKEFGHSRFLGCDLNPPCKDFIHL